MFIRYLSAGVATALSCCAVAQARPAEVLVTGITVASLGNPYYIATDRGISAQAAAKTPHARLTFVSADYDLGKQSTQIDNFIASGAQIIMIAAADPNAIGPAI